MHKYKVELTNTAEKTYRRIFESAQQSIESGSALDSKITTWQTVDELIDVIIPRDPFNKQNALSHPLSGVYWVSRERLRLFYAASHKPKTVVVLSISDSPRKEIHSRQIEAIIIQMLLAGQLDSLLNHLGLQVITPRIGIQAPFTH